MNFPEMLEYFDQHPEVRRLDFVQNIDGKKFKVLAYTIIPKAGPRMIRIDIKEFPNA